MKRQSICFHAKQMSPSCVDSYVALELPCVVGNLLFTFGKRVSLTSRRTLKRQGQIQDRQCEKVDKCCNTTLAYASSIACTAVAKRRLRICSNVMFMHYVQTSGSGQGELALIKETNAEYLVGKM